MGAYIVAKENLGTLPSLIAGASLLIDYVLTVSVSIAAGVAAITSALPHWRLDPVMVCLGFVVLLMMGNLRGIRESGRIFAGPTYFFIVSILTMIAVGAWRYFRGTLEPLPTTEHSLPSGTTALPMFVLLTASNTSSKSSAKIRTGM